MTLDRNERQQLFIQRALSEKLEERTIRWEAVSVFGKSNSAGLVHGGVMLGGPNLETKHRDIQGLCIISMLRFPPEDDVYFAVYVASDLPRFFERLDRMVEQARSSSGPIPYSDRNNNVRVYLAPDGQLYMHNSSPNWDSVKFDDPMPYGPAVKVDRIICAVYPPTPSTRRSLMAREFMGYLGTLVGPDRIAEVKVWPEGYGISADMKRLPAALPLDAVENGIRELGGYYTGDLVEQYHIAMGHLRQKHFVILTGISGSGKTQLASLYARAVHGLPRTAEDPFYVLCAVRPDWTDPSGLLGYFDPISRRYNVSPFLEAVMLATAYRETPVFVCIDEMNLARVEYYFSDVLSAMESGEPMALHGHSVPLESTAGEPVPSRLPLPENLYITGTVNIDETTHPFSDKVLDRATVIEMSDIDIEGFLDGHLRAREGVLGTSIDEATNVLVQLGKVLQPHGAGFGYRVVEELIRYHAHALKSGRTSGAPLMDALLLQKVLPKVRGNERQRPMLGQLQAILASYPRSLEAVQRMRVDLDDLGSFQYWR